MEKMALDFLTFSDTNLSINLLSFHFFSLPLFFRVREKKKGKDNTFRDLKLLLTYQRCFFSWGQRFSNSHEKYSHRKQRRYTEGNLKYYN